MAGLLVALLMLFVFGSIVFALYGMISAPPPPSPLDVEPSAVRIPRGEHPPDPERARRALAESVLLLESARGSFAAPFAIADDPDLVHVDTHDLIDAVQHARDGLALVRDAAERDDGVREALVREGVDPWTEPRCLEAVLYRGSADAWRDAEGFARWVGDAARRALDGLTTGSGSAR